MKGAGFFISCIIIVLFGAGCKQHHKKQQFGNTNISDVIT